MHTTSHRSTTDKSNVSEIMTINNWGVVTNGNGYIAPELLTISLVGDVDNHPKLGKQRVQTSFIVKVEGNIVHTFSGSVYKLGTIDPEYLNWLNGNNIEYDPINPLRIKEG